jgi:hypothetical protein
MTVEGAIAMKSHLARGDSYDKRTGGSSARKTFWNSLADNNGLAGRGSMLLHFVVLVAAVMVGFSR